MNYIYAPDGPIDLPSVEREPPSEGPLGPAATPQSMGLIHLDASDEATAALRVTRLTLEEEWLGHRLTKELVQQAFAVLGLLSEHTLVGPHAGAPDS